MDFETLKEMWEMTEGGEMPKGFLAACQSYYKHICVFRQHAFDERDFAICVLNYKLFKMISDKGGSAKHADRQKEKSE